MWPEKEINYNTKAETRGNNHSILHNSRLHHLDCFIQFLQFLCKLTRQPHRFHKCDASLNDCVAVKSLFHYIFLFFPLSPYVPECPNPPFNLISSSSTTFPICGISSLYLNSLRATNSPTTASPICECASLSPSSKLRWDVLPPSPEPVVPCLGCFDFWEVFLPALFLGCFPSSICVTNRALKFQKPCTFKVHGFWNFKHFLF